MCGDFLHVLTVITSVLCLFYFLETWAWKWDGKLKFKRKKMVSWHHLSELFNSGENQQWSNRYMAFCIQRSQETQRILIQILTYIRGNWDLERGWPTACWGNLSNMVIRLCAHLRKLTCLRRKFQECVKSSASPLFSAFL